jgi:hypothetical protein
MIGVISPQQGNSQGGLHAALHHPLPLAVCGRPRSFSACAGHRAYHVQVADSHRLGEQTVDLAEERLHMGLLQMSVKIGLSVPIFVEHKAAGIVCVGVEIIIDATRFGARRRDLGGENAQQFGSGFRLGDNGPDDGDVCHQLPPMLAPSDRGFCADLYLRSTLLVGIGHGRLFHRSSGQAGHVVLDEETINSRSAGASLA